MRNWLNRKSVFAGTIVLGLECLAACAPVDSTGDGASSSQNDADDLETKGVSAQPVPVLLMAGQSNMVGNVDEPLFSQLLSELSAAPASTMQARLKGRLRAWYTREGVALPDTVGTLLSSELIRLKNENLVGPFLRTPLTGVMCDWYYNEPIGLAPGCGNPFGPELVAGRYLYSKGYTTSSLIKVAEGGTTLFGDWRPPRTVAQSGGRVGAHYLQLQNRIDSLKSNPASIHPSCTTQSCRFSAFVWFQGENDAFDQAGANAYAKNLTNLIADVRARVGVSTLPVVIVQINEWAQSMDFGAKVAAAQQAVVAADVNARLVKTNDLGPSYHYDPAGQLIIGERVGAALTALLGKGGGGGGTTGGGTTGGGTTGGCSDTPGFVDAKGSKCAEWIGFNCSNADTWLGYTQAEENQLIANCRASCRQCGGTTGGCSDTPGFVDAKGSKCAEWVGFNCSNADTWLGYTQAQENQLIANCRASCRKCGG